MTNDNDDVRCSLSFVISHEYSKLKTYIQHRAGLKYVSNRQAREAGARTKFRAEGATIYCNCIFCIDIFFLMSDKLNCKE